MGDGGGHIAVLCVCSFPTGSNYIDDPTTARLRVNGVPHATSLYSANTGLGPDIVQGRPDQEGSRGPFTLCGQAKADDASLRGFSGDMAFFALFEVRAACLELRGHAAVSYVMSTEPHRCGNA